MQFLILTLALIMTSQLSLAQAFEVIHDKPELILKEGSAVVVEKSFKTNGQLFPTGEVLEVYRVSNSDRTSFGGMSYQSVKVIFLKSIKDENKKAIVICGVDEVKNPYRPTYLKVECEVKLSSFLK